MIKKKRPVGRPPSEHKKIGISIRLDEDIVQWFADQKLQRSPVINAMLRDKMAQEKTGAIRD